MAIQLYNVQSALGWKNCISDLKIFVELQSFMILPKACDIVPVFLVTKTGRSANERG